MHVETIDRFLADCVRSWLRSERLPAWPDGLGFRAREVVDRISFHGIVLLLWEKDPVAAGWPADLTATLRKEAMAQSFWESSHHAVISDLIEALIETGIRPVVMKGTALAYSLYPHPAQRRRGDTDILIPKGARPRARSALAAKGFRRVGDSLNLQEMWCASGREGFDHLIDLHWRINASANVSRHLERGDMLLKDLRIDALSPHALRTDPLVNLILVCINRSQHQAFGYSSEGRKLFDGDRLIWAVDLDLTCASLDRSEWERLVRIVDQTGSAVPVRTGLEFAERMLGTPIPEDVTERIGHAKGASDLNRHLYTTSSLERLKLDLAATPDLREKAEHLWAAIAPGPDKLKERFPGHEGWPVTVLRTRRLVEAVFRSVRGKA